jgi:hypothetical protein
MGEPEVTCRPSGSGDVEPVRVGEGPRVTVGGGDRGGDAVARTDQRAAYLDVLPRVAGYRQQLRAGDMGFGTVAGKANLTSPVKRDEAICYNLV